MRSAVFTELAALGYRLDIAVSRREDRHFQEAELSTLRDLAGIAIVGACELDRLLTGLDRPQVDDCALCLRDDLLGHDEDVVGA